MIYFLEHDTAGNIHMIGCNPSATIVPLINIAFIAKDGVQQKDASGRPLSTWGLSVQEPVGIDQASFDMLMANKSENYFFDIPTGTVKARSTDGN
jgi:hypothetical protein